MSRIDLECACAMLAGCRSRKKPSLEEECPEKVTINETYKCEIKRKLGNCDFENICQLPRMMQIIKDRGGV